MGEMFNPWHLVIIIVCIFLATPGFFNVFSIPPFWKIFKKAGFSPALSLLMLLPIVNLIMLYVVTSSNHPAFNDFVNDPPLADKDAGADEPAAVVTTNASTKKLFRDSFKASSEGVRRLGLAVAIIATVASLFIIGANVTTESGSVLVPISVLIGSVVIGGVVWCLVRLVDWTVSGFRTKRAE